MAPTTLIEVLQPLESPVPALIFCPSKDNPSSVSLSRSQVFKLAAETAEKLSLCTVGASSRQQVVGLSMKNTLEFVICFLAVTGSGHIAFPLNPTVGEKEAGDLLREAKVDLLVVDSATSAVLKSSSSVGAVFLMAEPFQLSLLASKEAPLPSTGTNNRAFPACSPDLVALYLFTSGTTSKPKLVPLTHHNMMVSVGNIRNTYELDALDRSYCVMPLFHIHGLQAALLASLLGGGSVLLPREGKFSAQAFWPDCIGFAATWYTCVPTIHQILLARRSEDAAWIAQHRLRFVRSCSSPLAPAVLQSLQDLVRVPVLEAYAMTEAAHQVCSNPLPSHGKAKPGSVGRAANVQLRVASSGEVLVRGDSVFSGYLNAGNQDAFLPHGWFRTGDLGYLDEDGYLFLVGRSKEMVNRGGEKISPFEVDSALLEMPGVREAVCFALPSEKYGEELAAAVVGDVTEAQVRAFCAGRLTSVKVPSRVFVVEAVPKSATGKIQRRNLTVFFAAKSKL